MDDDAKFDFMCSSDDMEPATVRTAMREGLCTDGVPVTDHEDMRSFFQKLTEPAYYLCESWKIPVVRASMETMLPAAGSVVRSVLCGNYSGDTEVAHRHSKCFTSMFIDSVFDGDQWVFVDIMVGVQEAILMDPVCQWGPVALLLQCCIVSSHVCSLQADSCRRQCEDHDGQPSCKVAS